MDSHDKYLYRDDSPQAFGGSCGRGQLREKPEYFQVFEQLGYDLSGEGDHLWLYVEKTATNTDWLARQLANYAQLRPVDVGYAGLKDRNAVTRQWFSLDMSGKQEPDWSIFEQKFPQIHIVEKLRHKKKLKRGGLKSNRFCIRVLHESGIEQCVQDKVSQIRDQGVPNYFGPQRFGNGGENVIKALKALSSRKKKLDRHKRSIYISALRAFLFNQVLARRVNSGLWNQYLPGDVLMLDGTNSIFSPQNDEPDIQSRIKLGDVHITGPMWGDGDLRSMLEANSLETNVINDYVEAKDCLRSVRNLAQERRSLRLMVRHLSAETRQGETQLRFEIESGAFATSVLREIFSCYE